MVYKINIYFPRFIDEEMDSGTLNDLPEITRLISGRTASDSSFFFTESEKWLIS